MTPLNNLLVKIFNSAIIRRKININKIYAITVSRIGFEFVIHVADEYDYRFLSLEKFFYKFFFQKKIHFSFKNIGGLK